MPFETPTLPALINRTQVDLADEALRQSDARVLSRAHSGAAYGLYGYQDWIADQILPDTADEETLERQAILRLRQPRKVAQAATGTVRFSAAAGAVLDADTVLQFSDGRFYRVTKGVTTVAGNNTTTVEAVDAGVLGNADAGLVMTAVQPVEGIDSTFTVIADGLSGGISQESIESLRARVVRSYRVIPHGGNQDDYVTWALEVPGVTRAWCVRRFMGPGTVAVFFMRDDQADPIPDAEQLAAVAAYIEPLHPVTADVYVLAPVQKPVVYTIRLTPDTSAVRAAVEAQLLDLHNREGGLGETLLLTHIAEAISRATGETDHVLVSPVANVTAAANQLLTFGGIQWSS
ncbi:baseplate J/gp47 family protein [Pseudomonas syringae]|uniref:baseplate J/gp47 family protein n=2 Tax=Pseudomonas syringae TaxID=317 RepID=UPI000CD0E8B7|nr:baseplate J/gp47 family protein [Pseudomonas syringae]MCF4983906.1 baseplate J protein [Pseudomonas syringae]MCF5205834.1 baseplate J protein [Pseudomonas syringae]MCF5273245.1 baseplate J protein [Pseudomonas syringae]MCF5274697.1 baseplate J protein [Pseudomonas syringae]MCF5283409.1 baseplate J protein [Pseudomonas syringae]